MLRDRNVLSALVPKTIILSFKLVMPVSIFTSNWEMGLSVECPMVVNLDAIELGCFLLVHV